MAKKKDFIKTDRVDEVMKEIAALGCIDVLVGVPDGSEHDGGISNAELAMIHYSGAPEINLPARDFISPAINAVRDKVATRLQKAADAALDGDDKAVEKQLNAAGITAVNSIKSTITTGDFTPLKPATIKRKGSDHPLIDTGELLRSITYVIVKGGK
jgi:hypothetical protein